MARRTRKNKRNNRNRNKTRSRRGGNVNPLPANANLGQVIAKLNEVIRECCSGANGASGAGQSTGEVLAHPGIWADNPGGGAHYGGSSKKKSRKKRKGGQNEFFKKMLAAKKAKAPSFEYNGNTYKATKGGNAGQLTVYKKA